MSSSDPSWVPVVMHRRRSRIPAVTKRPPPSHLSAEVFVIPVEEGTFIVYAPLRRAAFVTNAAGVNALADLQDGRPCGDGALVDLLRRLEILDGGPEMVPDDIVTGAPQPTALTLFLTTACNLRCQYCYAAAGDTPLERMTLATAAKGIDFVLANALATSTGRISIAYHGGGEATLNWPVMTGSLEYAREQAGRHGLGVFASTATNGVLQEHQVDWLIDNLDGASVSFDGLPSVHDAHRLTVAGTPSSGRVMRTLSRFDAAGFPYTVRITVTADQIAQLPASVDFICSQFRPGRIQVEPAYQLGRWQDSPTSETEEFIAAYRRAQAAAYRHGREISYSAARLGLVTNHFCGTTRDLFALSPNGNVSGCYEVFSEDDPCADTFFYGTADDAGGYAFDHDALEGLRQQAVRHHEFCNGCFAKWSCGGDCYHKALTANPTGRFEGSDRCHITRELTKDQILEAIVRSGGVLWHDGTSGPGRTRAVHNDEESIDG